MTHTKAIGRDFGTQLYSTYFIPTKISEINAIMERWEAEQIQSPVPTRSDARNFPATLAAFHSIGVLAIECLEILRGEYEGEDAKVVGEVMAMLASDERAFDPRLRLVESVRSAWEREKRRWLAEKGYPTAWAEWVQPRTVIPSRMGMVFSVASERFGPHGYADLGPWAMLVARLAEMAGHPKSHLA